MKFFVALIVCSLTPFILANDDNYYSASTSCRCVDVDLCSYKFSKFIEPRSPKHHCSQGQVCCKPEHIIPSSNQYYEDVNVDSSSYEDDSYDQGYYQPVDNQKKYPTHQKCGLRTKISAYKRLVLPASYASLGEFPWQAALLRNYSEGFVFVSSGVLIDRDVILTAAHSLENLSANNILVRLGENNVQADPKRKYHHINARVSKVLIKDDFNPDTLENDFAVLCLEKRVRCNEVVSPICLPEPSDYIDNNAKCTVSGWGKGSYNGNYSTILRKAHLNLVPQDRCQYLIRKRIQDPSYVLDKSFVCAGGELGRDACVGDGGGPLSCTNKNGQQVLTGIVSFGIGCGEKNVPGVYANLRDPASLNWIRNVAIRECRRRDYPENYNNPLGYNNAPNYENVPLPNYDNKPISDLSYNRVETYPNNKPAKVNAAIQAAANNYNNRPVDQYNNRPVDQYNNRPVDQYNNRPVEQYNNRPVDQYNNKPADQYENRPAESWAAI